MKKYSPKNRYQRASKLSEYKFLQILRGFADDKTAKEYATDLRVSEKSIRAHYMLLRKQLTPATMKYPHNFGGAGHFLFKSDELTPTGKAFLSSVKESRIFQNHMKRHAPRLKNPRDGGYYLFEVTVRVFCTLFMPKALENVYPPETREALQQFNNITTWIAENKEHISTASQYQDIMQRLARLTDIMPELLAREELLALKTTSREHVFSHDLLYDHLRRYLLKSPL